VRIFSWCVVSVLCDSTFVHVRFDAWMLPIRVKKNMYIYCVVVALSRIASRSS